MDEHTLSFTGHTHIGPAKHRLTGRCSCGGATFQSTAQSDIKARRAVRVQFNRHVGKQAKK